MAELKARAIADALLQIANSFPERGDSAESETEAESASERGIESLAALIRALSPASSASTNVADVAALLLALCPADSPASSGSRLARLIHAVSPAAEAGGRARLEQLIAALSPAWSAAQVADAADAIQKSESAKTPKRADQPSANLAARQKQAAAVVRALWPVLPKMDVDGAVAFLKKIAPGERPVAELASLIAALSPADDQTFATTADAARFIKGLSGGAGIPASDLAMLIRALSPADKADAGRPSKIAALVRVLYPKADQRDEVAALIRALSPASSAQSNPVEIAQLIRELSPANITPAEVFLTLSPAASA